MVKSLSTNAVGAAGPQESLRQMEGRIREGVRAEAVTSPTHG